MPRKSAAELAVTGLQGRVGRLRPPAALSGAERETFNATVNSCDAEHFRQSDLPLLCRWAEHNVLAELAASEMRQGGAVVDGRPIALAPGAGKSHTGASSPCHASTAKPSSTATE